MPYTSGMTDIDGVQVCTVSPARSRAKLVPSTSG